MNFGIQSTVKMIHPVDLSENHWKFCIWEFQERIFFFNFIFHFSHGIIHFTIATDYNFCILSCDRLLDSSKNHWMKHLKLNVFDFYLFCCIPSEWFQVNRIRFHLNTAEYRLLSMEQIGIQVNIFSSDGKIAFFFLFSMTEWHHVND